jgi:hypothetical protein
MTKAKTFLVGVALAALTASALWAQLGSRTLTGNEVVQVAVGGPGGTSIFVPVSQLRGGVTAALTSQATGTLTPVMTNAQGLLISTTASTSLTVQLPLNPYDGQAFVWTNGSAGAFTAGTIAAADGSTIVGTTAAGTLAVGASIQFVYILSTNTWYKVR